MKNFFNIFCHSNLTFGFWVFVLYLKSIRTSDSEVFDISGFFWGCLHCSLWKEHSEDRQLDKAQLPVESEPGPLLQCHVTWSLWTTIDIMTVAHWVKNAFCSKLCTNSDLASSSRFTSSCFFIATSAACRSSILKKLFTHLHFFGHLT